MKKSCSIIIVLAIFILVSCKKDNEAQKPVPVSDLQFSLLDVKTENDAFITNIITYPNTFMLKSDGKWALNLSGAYSHGTYKWIPGELYKAKIKFIIEEWNPLASNVPMCDKIKFALEKIDQCAFPGPGINTLHFNEATYTTTLRTIRK